LGLLPYETSNASDDPGCSTKVVDCEKAFKEINNPNAKKITERVYLVFIAVFVTFN
jgi:hypothetical protein